MLGDLFDFWIGDDDNSDFSKLIQYELKKLTELGVPCFFIQGNRDFLLGKHFLKHTGMQLLEDETVIDLYGCQVLIMHGDTLCIHDEEYLEYRKKVRKPWLKWMFTHIPLYIRRIIATKIQSNLKKHKENKPLDVMDVTLSEVEKVLNFHSVNLMIHGHTHNPGIHELNTEQGNRIRIVLGDWYTQGSVLAYTEHGYELQVRPFNEK
ncbi:UDP-2,3-diacylglucosamine hydrolase [Candidatus Photodesmus blepharus]|uniref:UDP-2,3-diacylglucosamine hydrolase n=1 Tax=Candidatus Photodesmus blepharonis TaxID=1179155 RepID=A0A084CPN0_9GAMM|nr:UDP-2,3-diacylglucosamine hydrolase [Candidatus Photodesmus blepharus]